MPKFLKISDNLECYTVNYTKENKNIPSLYISAGIHGDDIAGPKFLDKLIDRSDLFDGVKAVIFPKFNKWGLANNSKHNEQGVDLDLDFGKFEQNETREHRMLLAQEQFVQGFDAAISLRKNTDGDGVFIYRPVNNKRVDILNRLIAVVAKIAPIDYRNKRIESPLSGDKIIEEINTASVNEILWLSSPVTKAFGIHVPENMEDEIKEKVFQACIDEIISYLKKDFTLEEDIQQGFFTRDGVGYFIDLDELYVAAKELSSQYVDVVDVDRFTCRESIIKEYAEIMKAGNWNWDESPILAYRLDGNIKLIEGNHRTEAAYEAGISQIPVVFVDDIITQSLKSKEQNIIPQVKIEKC